MVKKTIFKVFLSAFIVICIIVSFSGCQQNLNILEYIRREGKLFVGTCADFPPYEFHKSSASNQDTIEGLDVFIAEEIAKDLGVKLEIKDIKLSGLLAALEVGKVDMVISAITPSDERKNYIAFSDIYFASVQKVMTRTTDNTINSVNDLQGKIIGVQKGSIQAEIAETKIPDAKLKEIDSLTDLIMELSNGKIDAIIIENTIGESYIGKRKDIKLSSFVIESDHKGAAIAVKKNNTALLSIVNRTLARLKKDGSLNRYYDKIIKANDTFALPDESNVSLVVED